MTDDMIRKITESLENETDEESDAIWNALIAKGIIDKDGNVLKRIPLRPEWLPPLNGHTSTTEAPAKPAKQTKKSRKGA